MVEPSNLGERPSSFNGSLHSPATCGPSYEYEEPRKQGPDELSARMSLRNSDSRSCNSTDSIGLLSVGMSWWTRSIAAYEALVQPFTPDETVERMK